MVRVIAFVLGVAAGVGLLLLLVAGLSFATPASAQAPGPSSVGTTQDAGKILAHPADPQGLPSLSDQDDPDDGSQVDLEGDEVTPAIAKYRFDAQGNIYETHAPHTEVPHLGAPTL